MDEDRLSELRNSNNELINQLATTSIDFRSVNNIRARSKLEDTINEQASEIEFLTTLVGASKQRLYKVSSAREIFDTYFNKSHDEAELQIKDTFMVLNIVINQRLNDTSFQRVEVLSVTELEKASNLLIQIECENLCKTEAALAAFHESNLRHLQPDLRPDKYPEELWALTDDTVKETANMAWKAFTPARLDIVILEMLKIDINAWVKNPTSVHRYLRTSTRGYIQTWMIRQ
jgi:hypothetical protein